MIRCLIIICGFWGHLAWAMPIASMDPNKVMNASKAWSDVKMHIDAYAQGIQNQVIERQKVLEEEWAMIKKMRDDMDNREKLVEKEKLFMQASTELQKFVQTAQDQMEKAYLDARNVLQASIFAIVKQIAEKNGYDVVLTETDMSFNSPYVYLNPTLSLNDQVIKILNAELPSIDLKLQGEDDAK